MTTRFRKHQTRKVKKSKALKTRKHRSGGGLLNRLGLTKKNPLTSASVPANMSSMNKKNFMSGRVASEAAFIKNRLINQKQKEFAKKLRNHMARMKSLNEATRQQSLNLMNSNSREKMRTLLDFPNLNSLSDTQLLDFYKTGKVRSQSV